MSVQTAFRNVADIGLTATIAAATYFTGYEVAHHIIGDLSAISQQLTHVPLKAAASSIALLAALPTTFVTGLGLLKLNSRLFTNRSENLNQTFKWVADYPLRTAASVAAPIAGFACAYLTAKSGTNLALGMKGLANVATNFGGVILTAAFAMAGLATSFALLKGQSTSSMTQSSTADSGNPVVTFTIMNPPGGPFSP